LSRRCDESNRRGGGLSPDAIVIGCPAMGTSDEEISRRLTALRVEHRDLDDSITALLAASHLDQLQLARLKRRKLKLKDEIALLEDQLIPDIIA
jgi:hypothetical protein